METHHSDSVSDAPDWINQLTNLSYIQPQLRTKFAAQALPSKINLAYSLNSTIQATAGWWPRLPSVVSMRFVWFENGLASGIASRQSFYGPSVPFRLQSLPISVFKWFYLPCGGRTENLEEMGQMGSEAPTGAFHRISRLFHAPVPGGWVRIRL